MDNRELNVYLERHRRGAPTEQDIRRRIAELRRLRGEAKAVKHELLQAQRTYSRLRSKLLQAGRFPEHFP